MTPYTQIRSQYWSGKLNAIGEIITNAEEIAQAIRLILTTPKGSDPYRAEFGSKVSQYLDQPINYVRPRIVRDTIKAIREWEKRVNVLSVEVFGYGELDSLQPHELLVQANVVLAATGTPLPIIETLFSR